MSFSSLLYSQKAIVIGDSQSSYIAMNSKAELYKPLFKVGIGLVKLNSLVLREPINYKVEFVFISIGVNDSYQYQELNFTETLKSTFPNAKFYMVPGSHGWGNVKKFNENYYNKFKVSVLKNRIGPGDPHRNKESYRVIGREINKILDNE